MMKRAALIASVLALVSAEDDEETPEYMLRLLEACQDELTACQDNDMCHKVLDSFGDENSELATADGGPPSCEGDAVCQAAVDCLMDNGIMDGEVDDFEDVEDFEEYPEEERRRADDTEEELAEEELYDEEDFEEDEMPQYMQRILENCQDELTACQEDEMCHKVLESFGDAESELAGSGEPDCEGDAVCQAAVDCLMENGVMDGEVDDFEDFEEYPEEERRRADDTEEELAEEELYFEEGDEEDEMPAYMQRILENCQDELTACQDDEMCHKVLESFGDEDSELAGSGEPDCDGDMVCQAAVDCLMENGVMDGDVDVEDDMEEFVDEERRRSDDTEEDLEDEFGGNWEESGEDLEDEFGEDLEDEFGEDLEDEFEFEEEGYEESDEADSEEQEKIAELMAKCADEFAACMGDEECVAAWGELDKSFDEDGDGEEDFNADPSEACKLSATCTATAECMIENAVFGPEDLPDGLPAGCEEIIKDCQEDEVCRKDVNRAIMFHEEPDCTDDVVCAELMSCFMANQPESDESFESFESFEGDAADDIASEELTDDELTADEFTPDELADIEDLENDEPADIEEEAGEAPGQAPDAEEGAKLRRF